VELPGREIGESRLRRSRIKSAKGRDEGGHLGKAVIEKDRELLRLDGKKRHVRMMGPPAEAPLGETASDEPVTEAVVTEQFESRSAPVTEDKEGAGERILGELLLAEGGEPIDAVAEIDGLAGDEDTELRDELNHRESPLRNSVQMILMMSRLDGGRVKRMCEPSRRSMRIWQRSGRTGSTEAGTDG
jgi:hypothetical protein